jgi:hypothetical protein
MAGLGRKEWSPGDTLNAADVNGYLMDQSVMVFAGTAARASAIPSPSAGMVAYSTATNLEYYDGSNWESVAVPSGLVPIVPTSVAVGGGAATFSSTTGKITATAATTSLSVNGVFSATYQNYLIQVMLTGMPTDVNMRFRVGGADNANNNYSSVLAQAQSGTNVINVAVANETISNIPSVARTSASTYMSFSNIQVSNAFSSADETAVMIDLMQLGNSQPLAIRWFGGSNLNVTTSYDGFTLLIASGSMTGNVQVFGYV